MLYSNFGTYHLFNPSKHTHPSQQGKSQMHLLHSSLPSVNILCAFYQPQQIAKMWGPKSFFVEPNQYLLIFLHSILNVKCHHIELQWDCSKNVQPKTQES
jgi:hypothetical protein